MKQTTTIKRKRLQNSRVLSLKIRHVVIILLSLVAIVYGQTILFNFTWFDDDAILLRNQEYISDVSNLPGSIIRDAEFNEKAIELYRPLQNVSFILDTWIGGFKPGVFHFFNVVLHLGVVLMLFFLLELFGFSRLLALIGGALLAVHPVFSFTVSWLPARGDLLLAFWSLAAIYAFMLFLRNSSLKYLPALHLLFFALAIFSKESAVVILPVCLFYYLFFHENRGWHKWQLFLGVGYVAILVIFFYLRSLAVADIKGEGFGFHALLYNLPVLPESLLKLFIPYPIVALPFYDMVRMIAGSMFIVLLLLAAFRYKNDWRFFLLGAGWFVGFTLPSMFYRPDWSDYIYDYIIHRSYLPLIGIIVVLMMLVRKFEPKLRIKPLKYITPLLFVALMVMSFNFSRVFKDPLAFWEYAVKTNPESAYAHLYLGGAWFFMENHLKAVESYNNAIKLKPDLAEAIINRGITQASISNHNDAVESFSQYLDLVPKDTMAMRYRAISLVETRRYPEALVDIGYLMEQGDSSARVRFLFGLSNLLTGNYSLAQDIMDVLVKESPSNAQYLRVAALADLMKGDADPAIEKYMVALTIEPPNQNSLANLGYAYWEKGEYQLSLSNFERAREMGEESLSLNLGLLLAYDAVGNSKALAETKERTTKLNPDLADYRTGMDKMKQQGYLFTTKQLKSLEKIFDGGK